MRTNSGRTSRGWLADAASVPIGAAGPRLSGTRETLGCHNDVVSEIDREVNALVVRQWLEEWELITFDEDKFQSRPPEMFLLASIPAKTLRSLSHAYRRDASPDTPRAADTSVQRHHEFERSDEIARFVRSGYPLSSFTPAKRKSAASSLRKPGWLPTAIVVNILKPGDTRDGASLAPEDAISVPDVTGWKRNGQVKLELPESWDGSAWTPGAIHPIEIIDGQHRLWAFSDDEADDLDDYDLPVVAYYGLDFSWQAYLFWTINIKPKKINASLAYDLYPLLRDQDWLEQGEGLSVYRETRSQELTEALWSYPTSVWRGRINMLGRTGVRAQQPVTQAAFVRGITESFVRSWSGPGTTIGGLFGGSQTREGLEWNRAQQAAFLIRSWNLLHEAVEAADEPWADALRTEHLSDILGDDAEKVYDGALDPAFGGELSLLASDQGVRPFMQVVNDVIYVAAEYGIDLKTWRSLGESDRISNEQIEEELRRLDEQPFMPFLSDLIQTMGSFDWRNSKSKSLKPTERTAKQALRGTGGYKLLRNALLEHVSTVASGLVAEVAGEVYERRNR